VGTGSAKDGKKRGSKTEPEAQDWTGGEKSDLGQIRTQWESLREYRLRKGFIRESSLEKVEEGAEIVGCRSH